MPENKPQTASASTPTAQENIKGLRGVVASVQASLIFFTRLPWWRWWRVPKEAFEHVADYWPLMGWLTGGLMAAVFVGLIALGVAPLVAVIVALASRLLLTGALHEDGLADFCDGFGGGTSPERTLSIMKDSHIGTYGVLGLIFYFGILWASLQSLYVQLFLTVSPVVTPLVPSAALCLACLIVLFDVMAKCAASLVTGQLPYARSASTAKNQVVYVGRSLGEWLWHAVRCTLALAPLILCCNFLGLSYVLWLLPVPFVVELFLVRWMRVRLGGYTGDCCGALFLLCELSLYLVAVVML